MLLLEKFEKQYVKDLVKILNTDDVLKERLCPSVVDKITEDEFWIKTNDWITKRNSKYFVILINGAVCGTISLSKVRNGVFNCGYWLASPYWGQHWGTQAFNMVLAEARRHGIHILHGHIPINNIVSYNIWRNEKASFEKKGNQYIATLTL